jgi:hypothetical protein
MTHKDPLVVDAFVDLMSALRQFTDVSGALSPYCVVVRFLEDDTEQRGIFYGWPYSDVEKCITLACSVAWTLTAGINSIERKALESRTAPDLTAFADLVKRLCKRDSGPFPACTVCQAQCQYRFEIARLESDAPMHGADFRAAFADPRVQLGELSRFAWEASAACVLENDIVTRQGAAVCFAAQQLARLGLPTYSQRDVGRGLYENIKKRGENPNG